MPIGNRKFSRTGAPAPDNEGKVDSMPIWFFVVLLLVVLLVVVLAVGMNRRSAGGQNTTIIERKD